MYINTPKYITEWSPQQLQTFLQLRTQPFKLKWQTFFRIICDTRWWKRMSGINQEFSSSFLILMNFCFSIRSCCYFRFQMAAIIYAPTRSMCTYIYNIFIFKSHIFCCMITWHLPWDAARIRNKTVPIQTDPQSVAQWTSPGNGCLPWKAHFTSIHYFHISMIIISEKKKILLYLHYYLNLQAILHYK
jgi:hypothetical protein